MKVQCFQVIGFNTPAINLHPPAYTKVQQLLQHATFVIGFIEARAEVQVDCVCVVYPGVL